MKLANLTLHQVTPEMQAWGAEQSRPETVGEYNARVGTDDREPGIRVVDENSEVTFSEPRGQEIDVTLRSWEVCAVAQEQIVRAQDGYEGVFVGGLTSLTFHQIQAAHEAGLCVFEAVTSRERDEHDRFIFTFRGLREIKPYTPMANSLHDGTFDLL